MDRLDHICAHLSHPNELRRKKGRVKRFIHCQYAALKDEPTYTFAARACVCVLRMRARVRADNCLCECV